jgi:hypothetical protein
MFSKKALTSPKRLKKSIKTMKISLNESQTIKSLLHLPILSPFERHLIFYFKGYYKKPNYFNFHQICQSLLKSETGDLAGNNQIDFFERITEATFELIDNETIRSFLIEQRIFKGELRGVVVSEISKTRENINQFKNSFKKELSDSPIDVERFLANNLKHYKVKGENGINWNLGVPDQELLSLTYEGLRCVKRNGRDPAGS